MIQNTRVFPVWLPVVFTGLTYQRRVDICIVFINQETFQCKEPGFLDNRRLTSHTVLHVIVTGHYLS